MLHFVVVSDDVPLCRQLEKVLRKEGHSVSECHSGERALHHMESCSVDLVLLDVSLPDIDGNSFARRICQRFATPILMLSVYSDEALVLEGYKSGADQYLVRPFKIAELLVRIDAIMRRVGLERKRYAMCHTVQQISNQISSLPLTDTESDLLSYLVSRRGDIISKAELQTKVLCKDISPFDRNLDMHISNIRRKLTSAGLSKQHIKTVRGKGYSYIERL
ncbi:response regulator transcription factor [Vibrio sp. HN007]|uniref:response regulator transcription factor n=1 Tax=Vibrio iocasae TaxID=3098914 RepID=UPI0035D4D698